MDLTTLHRRLSIMTTRWNLHEYMNPHVRRRPYTVASRSRGRCHFSPLVLTTNLANPLGNRLCRFPKRIGRKANEASPLASPRLKGWQHKFMPTSLWLRYRHHILSNIYLNFLPRPITVGHLFFLSNQTIKNNCSFTKNYCYKPISFRLYTINNKIQRKKQHHAGWSTPEQEISQDIDKQMLSIVINVWGFAWKGEPIKMNPTYMTKLGKKLQRGQFNSLMRIIRPSEINVGREKTKNCRVKWNTHIYIYLCKELYIDGTREKLRKMCRRVNWYRIFLSTSSCYVITVSPYVDQFVTS